jgi:hypothetical protein
VPKKRSRSGPRPPSSGRSELTPEQLRKGPVEVSSREELEEAAVRELAAVGLITSEEADEYAGALARLPRSALVLVVRPRADPSRADRNKVVKHVVGCVDEWYDSVRSELSTRTML